MKPGLGLQLQVPLTISARHSHNMGTASWSDTFGAPRLFLEPLQFSYLRDAGKQLTSCGQQWITPSLPLGYISVLQELLIQTGSAVRSFIARFE